jgi:LPS-assembly lipoprotein
MAHWGAPRRAFLALSASLAGAGLALAGCGWEPLYGDPQTGPAAAELRAIKVNPIPERIGQLLEIDLRNWLNPTGIPTPSRYVLNTTLQYSLSSLGIQSQGTATLGQIDVHSTSKLNDIRTGRELLQFSLHDQNSFELNPNQYSTVVGEQDAGLRTIAELRRQIVFHLAMFMEKRIAEGGAKTVERAP